MSSLQLSKYFIDKGRSRFTIQEGNIKTEFDAKKKLAARRNIIKIHSWFRIKFNFLSRILLLALIFSCVCHFDHLRIRQMREILSLKISFLLSLYLQYRSF